MTDTPARLRGAVDAVMAHQWSHSRDAMQALTDLVDAAAAGADELDRVHAERDESAVEVVRLIGLIDDLTVERDILRRDNDNHRASVHSCHAGCTRAGCVNERLRAALDVAGAALHRWVPGSSEDEEEAAAAHHRHVGLNAVRAGLG